MQYENYQMDMLRNIASMFAGKGAKLPPRYCDIASKKNSRSVKMVTVKGVMKNLEKHLS